MADDLVLTTDDYKALHQMLLSPDESIRTQGQALAKKLTPAESQAFFDYQQTANKGKGELTRQDDPQPELLIAGGLGAGAALARGIFLRHVVAPTVAGEGTRRGLKAVGLPAPLPELGGAAAAILTGRALSPSVPAAASVTEPEAPMVGPQRPILVRGPNGKPIAIDPATAPGVDTTRAIKQAVAQPAASAPTKSPQQLLNEEALARRRAMYQASQAKTAPVETTSEGLGKLSADEVKLAFDLKRAGKSEAEIQDTIKASREFADKFGLPVPSAMDKRFPKGMRGKPQLVREP